MPSYSATANSPVYDEGFVENLSYRNVVPLLLQQPSAPSGNVATDFKTAMYICACLNDYSFENALTGKDLQIIEYMLGSIGYKGQDRPRALHEYTDVLQELVNEGAIVHVAKGAGFMCPAFMIKAKGRVDSVFSNGMSMLHFVNEKYNVPLFSKYILLKGDEVEVVINGLTHIAALTEVTKMRTLLIGEFYKKNKAPLFRDSSLKGLKFILTGDSISARQGDMVLVEILNRSEDYSLTVRIREVVHDIGSMQSLIIKAVLEHNIPNSWPEAVKLQLPSIPEKVENGESKGRVDLRDIALVTIDGEDARDFDDAVYCEPEQDGFRLLVAIADVSYYVTRGSALDLEAKNRCNSVYFPYYVIPMLPEKLSNGICSLNPDVERMCMVCSMHIDRKGIIGDYEFFPAVMKSHGRLTYTEAYTMITEGRTDNEEHTALIPNVKQLHELYKVLKQAREKRGAFEFEQTEVDFVFGDEWEVVGLEPTVRNDAHMMIEECMIAANICAAKFVKKNQCETLYRVHAAPTEEKLEKLRGILSRYGIDLKGFDKPSPQDFKKVAEEVAKLPAEYQPVIGLQLLRSMSKAVYSPDNIGHFGLALEDYAHFTSPIRRYPDLQLHRVIKAILEKGGKHKWGKIGASLYNHEELVQLGFKCTEREIAADDAEFDVDNSLKCAYVANFIGSVVPATVSTVSSMGVFVTLNDFFIDGKLDDVSVNNAEQSFTVVYNNKIFKPGDQIFVRIMGVDVPMRRIELMFTESKKKLANKDRIKRSLIANRADHVPDESSNQYKDRLFERIASFKDGRVPDSNSLAVRHVNDFGLDRVMEADSAAKVKTEKKSRIKGLENLESLRKSMDAQQNEEDKVSREDFEQLVNREMNSSSADAGKTQAEEVRTKEDTASAAKQVIAPASVDVGTKLKETVKVPATDKDGTGADVTESKERVEPEKPAETEAESAQSRKADLKSRLKPDAEAVRSMLKHLVEVGPAALRSGKTISVKSADQNEDTPVLSEKRTADVQYSVNDSAEPVRDEDIVFPDEWHPVTEHVLSRNEMLESIADRQDPVDDSEIVFPGESAFLTEQVSAPKEKESVSTDIPETMQDTVSDEEIVFPDWHPATEGSMSEEERFELEADIPEMKEGELIRKAERNEPVEEVITDQDISFPAGWRPLTEDVSFAHESGDEPEDEDPEEIIVTADPVKSAESTEDAAESAEHTKAEKAVTVKKDSGRSRKKKTAESAVKEPDSSESEVKIEVKVKRRSKKAEESVADEKISAAENVAEKSNSSDESKTKRRKKEAAAETEHAADTEEKPTVKSRRSRKKTEDTVKADSVSEVAEAESAVKEKRTRKSKSEEKSTESSADDVTVSTEEVGDATVKVRRRVRNR